MEQDKISTSAQKIGQILENLAHENRIEQIKLTINGSEGDELHKLLINLNVKEISITTTSYTSM